MPPISSPKENSSAQKNLLNAGCFPIAFPAQKASGFKPAPEKKPSQFRALRLASASKLYAFGQNFARFFP
jgi:hypothetical protein